MYAQTKRWGLDSKGKGWNRNLPFPLVAPLVPFRRCGKERKKENKIYKKYPSFSNINLKPNIPINANV